MSARLVTLAAILSALALDAQLTHRRPITHVKPLPPLVKVEEKTFPPPAEPAADAQWFAGWESRASRFGEIREKPNEKDKLWAMQVLYLEAAFMQRHFARTGEPLGEEYGAYYIDLGLFVTQLKDPRSIEALAVATDIAPVVSSTLAEFGDAAVEPVVRTLNNPFLRESGAYTLGKFLQGSEQRRIQVAPEKMQRIRGVLTDAVVSGPPSLQKNAVRALRHVKLTPEEAQILRSIEASPNTMPAVKLEIRRAVQR